MQARDVEKDRLLQRLSDMEIVLQQQQQVNAQAQQTITKLQAQIILLEERYRLTSNGGADRLQENCLSQHAGPSFRHGAEADSPGALRSAMSVPGTSAFAAAAAAAAATAAASSAASASVLETSSSAGSSSTTTAGHASSIVPSGGGDSSCSSAEGAACSGNTPWSQGAAFSAFGLHPAPSAPSHLAAVELPGGSLPVLQPSLDALVSPLPTSLSGLSRSLSLSATAAGVKQPHKPRQPGGSAGGALGGDHNSSSEEFVQVCWVGWQLHQL